MKNKQFKFRIISIFLGISLVINGIFVSSIAFDFDLPFFQKTIVDENEYNEYKKFKKIVNLKSEIDEKYYKEVSEDKLIEGAVNGMFYALNDKYSYYIPKEELKKKQNSEKGISIGIGISINILEDGKIKVVSVDQEGTAMEAGLKVNDIITDINGIELNLDTIHDALGEVSKDNKKYIIFGDYPNINITVIRDNKELKLEVQRKKMIEKALSYEIMDNNIGYIKIEHFIQDTPKYFKEALSYMNDNKIDKIIIDLRNNPGGLLSSVVKTTGYLVGKEEILYTENKNEEKKIYSADSDKIYDGKVCVIVNDKSASASEAMTAALKDYDRAVILGTNTFGKGIVQTTYPLTDGTGYKLTTNEYFSPKGNKIHKIGIKPDIEITDSKIQLEKALDLLSKEK